MEDRYEALMNEYFQIKDAAQRYEIIKLLLCDLPSDAKEFFGKAFKKERYLDMKLAAVRGYAAYAAEEEVAPLMGKLMELLKKRAAQTPYDYTEYEPMRSVFLMPYLLKHYDYECFRLFNQQLEKQYDEMPECFKNIFTLDEYGKMHEIRDNKEVSQSLENFWKE